MDSNFICHEIYLGINEKPNELHYFWAMPGKVKSKGFIAGDSL